MAIGARPCLADQSSVLYIEELAHHIGETAGKIDILFINAGITGDNTLIEEATEINFDNVMNVNLKGAYFTLSRLTPSYKLRGFNSCAIF